MTSLLDLRPEGLYCPVGDFHIDPWRGVPRAVVTHAHSDHARSGSTLYLSATSNAGLLRKRLGAGIALETLDYGQEITRNGVKVSLHPAGHVLGSSQIRMEYRGEICVVSGDYKLERDPTCTPFEPVRCHTFLTESTFGMPIYRWQPNEQIFDEINRWWKANRDAGKASVVYAYSLGKAQRLMAGVDPSIGPIFLHGAVEELVKVYRAEGVALPEASLVSTQPKKHSYAGALAIAPPSADGTPWLKRFEPYSSAVASGWMLVRGTRRQRSVDRGFVLSDHVDWPSLNSAIEATGAENILVTHGFSAIVARYWTERGKNARPLETDFGKDAEEKDDGVSEAVAVEVAPS
jgi:putative mRNA 3-end processing factor